MTTSKSTPIMRCGHAANAYTNNDPTKPVCVICYGILADADQVMETPDLFNRKARCTYYGGRIRKNKCDCDKCKAHIICQCEEPSSTELWFFEYRPNEPYDSYYCACLGSN